MSEVFLLRRERHSFTGLQASFFFWLFAETISLRFFGLREKVGVQNGHFWPILARFGSKKRLKGHVLAGI